MRMNDNNEIASIKLQNLYICLITTKRLLWMCMCLCWVCKLQHSATKNDTKFKQLENINGNKLVNWLELDDRLKSFWPSNLNWNWSKLNYTQVRNSWDLESTVSDTIDSLVLCRGWDLDFFKCRVTSKKLNEKLLCAMKSTMKHEPENQWERERVKMWEWAKT